MGAFIVALAVSQQPTRHIKKTRTIPAGEFLEKSVKVQPENTRKPYVYVAFFGSIFAGFFFS